MGCSIKMKFEKSHIWETLNISMFSDDNNKTINKLDRVGPVDNRPSTDELHHFVQKEKKKKVTCDT